MQTKQTTIDNLNLDRLGLLSILFLALWAVAPRAAGQPRPSLGLRFSAGQPILSVTGAVGTVYSIQYATGLSSTNPWVDLTLLQAHGISSVESTTPVGRYAANPWGLYDLIGNVFEWCQDWYGPYRAGSVTDPQGAASGSYRVIRGGRWYLYGATLCRSASRNYDYPVTSAIGFRVLLALGQP